MPSNRRASAIAVSSRLGQSPSSRIHSLRSPPGGPRTNPLRAGVERAAYIVLLAVAAVTMGVNSLSAEQQHRVERWLTVQAERTHRPPTTDPTDDADRCYATGDEILSDRTDLDLTSAERTEIASAISALMARSGAGDACLSGLAAADGLITIKVRSTEPDGSVVLAPAAEAEAEAEADIVVEIDPQPDVGRQTYLLLPGLATRTRQVSAEFGVVKHLVLARDTGGHSFLLLVDVTGGCALVVAIAGRDPDALTFTAGMCVAIVREAVASKRIIWAAQDSETLILRDGNGVDEVFGPSVASGGLTDLEVAALRCVLGRYAVATAWFPGEQSRAVWPLGVPNLATC